MKSIIIIGCAPCWEEDFENFKILVDEFDVMAIGADCPYGGAIQYFATYHFVDIPIYKMRRKNANCNLDFKVICHKNQLASGEKLDVDIVELHKTPSGSSSLLGAAAAIHLGYKNIVLCGCPMEGDNKNKITPYNTFQIGWASRLSEIKNYVRSMSGYTKEILGRPTKEWLGI